MRRLGVVLMILLAPVVAQAAWVADLVWQDNATNESGFKVVRKVGATGAPEPVALVGANMTAFTDPGPFLEGVQYCWVILATNAAGDADRRAGDEACAVVLAKPQGATGVTAVFREMPDAAADALRQQLKRR